MPRERRRRSRALQLHRAVDRAPGPLPIAISTGGAAPTVAKRLRRHVQEHLGAEWETYVTLLGEVRALVMERVPGGEAERKPLFEAIADSDLLDRIAAGASDGRGSLRRVRGRDARETRGLSRRS